MATIIGVALPFFAVLLCGMLATRLKLIDAAGLIGLNAFVFWFALPALLLQKVAATPFERLADWTLYVAHTGSCLILYALVLMAVRFLLGRSLAQAAICAFAATWGNVGYLGVPLLIAAYGEEAALPSVLAVVLDTLVLQSLTILLIESDGGGGGSKGGLAPVGRAVARNPLILAVLLGAAVAWADVEMPTPVAGFLALLAPAGGVAALFALGGTLRGGVLTRDLGLTLALTAAKLVLLPLIALLVVQGLPVRPDMVTPILVTTALPTAATVYVVAQRYRVLEGLAAAVVFVSHLVGIATLTGVLVLFER